ncbi:MAG TPA: hypothetical protein VN764_18940, partial [Polyangiaceae bacterium]|nr:hypothetical protein [Polyangiaceae bacterium]
HIYQRTACSRAVQGEGRLEVAGPFAGYRGKLMFKAEAPAQLRFDLYSELGVTLATLVAQKSALRFFDLSANTLVSGEPSACNVAQFTQVAVPPLALVELLRGRPPVLRHEPSAAKLAWKNTLFGPGHYEITLAGDHLSKEEVWVSIPEQDWGLPLAEQRTFVTRVQVWQDGSTLYSVELSDYQRAHRASLEPTQDERDMGITELEATGPVCESELPRRLAFDVGHVGHELRIQAREVAHNPPRVEGAYELQAPRGVRVVSSACK